MTPSRRNGEKQDNDGNDWNCETLLENGAAGVKGHTSSDPLNLVRASPSE